MTSPSVRIGRRAAGWRLPPAGSCLRAQVNGALRGQTIWMKLEQPLLPGAGDLMARP